MALIKPPKQANIVIESTETSSPAATISSTDNTHTLLRYHRILPSGFSVHPHALLPDAELNSPMFVDRVR